MEFQRVKQLEISKATAALSHLDKELAEPMQAITLAWLGDKDPDIDDSDKFIALMNKKVSVKNRLEKMQVTQTKEELDEVLNPKPEAPAGTKQRRR